MPIDPNIALSGRPVQMPNILEQAAQMISLKNAMTQGRMADLQAQQLQTDITEGQQFKSALQRGATPEELTGISPTRGIAYQKNLLDLKKTRLEHDLKQTEFIGQMLGGAKDQATYEDALSGLMQAGVDVSKMGAQYDPATVAAWRNKGMTIAQQLDEQHKAVTEEISKSNAAETNRHNQATETQSVNTLAETTRHNQADEGKATQHPIQIDLNGKPVPAVQEIRRDGTSRVLYQGQEIPNPKIYHAPNVALLNKDELEPVLDSVAKDLAGGDLTRIKDISSLRGDQRLRLYAKVKAINPNFNQAEVDRKIKMVDYYANGKGANNLQSFNTFLEHGGAAKDAVDQIYNTQSKYFNKPLNWWRENMSGDPNYINLIGALEPVRKEFEGFLLGGRALYGEDRAAAEKILSDDASPAQINAALKRMGHTAEARGNEENWRYKKVMGEDIPDMYSPEALDGAKKIGLKLKGSPDAQAKPSFSVGQVVIVKGKKVKITTLHPDGTFDGEEVK